MILSRFYDYSGIPLFIECGEGMRMHLAKEWRLNPQRYCLEGASDEQGNVTFPPRPNVEQRLPEHYEFELEEEATAEVTQVIVPALLNEQNAAA